MSLFPNKLTKVLNYSQIDGNCVLVYGLNSKSAKQKFVSL